MSVPLKSSVCDALRLDQFYEQQIIFVNMNDKTLAATEETSRQNIQRMSNCFLSQAKCGPNMWGQESGSRIGRKSLEKLVLIFIQCSIHVQKNKVETGNKDVRIF